MPEVCLVELVKKENISQDIFKFSVKAPNVVKEAQMGQFIEIRVSEGITPFLRRPISIYNIDRENEILEFIFQIKGKGTEYLSKIKVGEMMDIIGPLGYGAFKIEDSQKLGIIGGGIGTFPLYELAKTAKKSNKNVRTYLGFRNKDFVVLEKEFEDVSSELIISTDDGSYKNHGYAIDFLKTDIEKGLIDTVYACGPLPMLKAVKKLAAEKNIPCQISLEERMACGLGVCLGCAVKTASSSKEQPEYVHVCSAGPVFDATYVEI